MTANSLSPILAGVASGLLFLLPLFTDGQLAGMFTILPLLYIGLRSGSAATLGAGLAGSIIVTLVAVNAVVNFALIDVLPAFIFIHLALQGRGRGETREWMPVGLVLAELSAYAALVTAGVFILQDMSGTPLVDVLRQGLDPAQRELAPDMAARLKYIVDDAPYLLLAMTIWFLLLLLYANAWIANILLKNNHKSLRPLLQLGDFTPPGWLLAALALMALGAVIGGHTVQLVAKTLLLTLFFPYFLFGLSLLHRATESWPSRSFARWMLYLLILTTLWPALVIAVYGLWKQAARLSQGSGKIS